MSIATVPLGRMARYCVEFDDQTTGQIQDLAAWYGLTEQEVLEQLVEVGLDEIERAP